jgi:hypothetical protein
LSPYFDLFRKKKTGEGAEKTPTNPEDNLKLPKLPCHGKTILSFTGGVVSYITAISGSAAKRSGLEF